MSQGLNRRNFLKKPVIGTAAIMSALSLEEKALLAAMNKRDKPHAGSAKGLPAGRIGKVKISRIICGGNLIGGFAHSRDLTYVSALLKHYFTDEKIIETLEICEDNGINTIITSPDSAELLKKYRLSCIGIINFGWFYGLETFFDEPISNYLHIAATISLIAGLGNLLYQENRNNN